MSRFCKKEDCKFTSVATMLFPCVVCSCNPMRMHIDNYYECKETK